MSYSIAVYTCFVSATRKYVRATSPEHAALVMAHWHQVTVGIAPEGWTTVRVNETTYCVNLLSGYVEKE